MRRERLVASVLAAFALLALVLACLGVYGTFAYPVTRRTSEIGIRVALGAKRVDIIATVLAEAALPVIVGVVLGAAGSLAADRNGRRGKRSPCRLVACLSRVTNYADRIAPARMMFS